MTQNPEEETRKDPAGQLKTELLAALEYPFSNDPALLLRQAKALDLAFRQLVNKGNGFSGEVAHYAAAFRAQQQCLFTLEAANTLKRMKKRHLDPPQK